MPFQAQVDQLTKLAPVSGSTTPPGVTLPGAGTGGSTDTTPTTTIPDLGALGGDTTTGSGSTTVPETSPPDASGGRSGDSP